LSEKKQSQFKLQWLAAAKINKKNVPEKYRKQSIESMKSVEENASKKRKWRDAKKQKKSHFRVAMAGPCQMQLNNAAREKYGCCGCSRLRQSKGSKGEQSLFKAPRPALTGERSLCLNR
jgi:hypothetical protein